MTPSNARPSTTHAPELPRAALVSAKVFFQLVYAVSDTYLGVFLADLLRLPAPFFVNQHTITIQDLARFYIFV
jgi:hypothetical protein